MHLRFSHSRLLTKLKNLMFLPDSKKKSRLQDNRNKKGKLMKDNDADSGVYK